MISYGFASASIIARRKIETTQKDTTSDALFTKNLPFRGVTFMTAETVTIPQQFRNLIITSDGYTERLVKTGFLMHKPRTQNRAD